MAIIAVLIRFQAYLIENLPFFDFGSNKELCPSFQSPLFGVLTVSLNDPFFDYKNGFSTTKMALIQIELAD